ncbi:MAG TPA: substrate-binding domain-containing protein [Anaerolineales bacterium]|nr:substrate-binding domain-containing protein [Anaerolineales bacterium]
MKAKKLTRREFLRMSALTAAGVGLAACGAPATTQAPATTAPPASTALSFWNMPFVTQEVSPEYVKQWEGAVAKALPNVTVDKFYGPGEYKPQRDKFLLQAKSATPDVIEGLLEDMGVYVKNSLIDPLDDRFNAWAEKDQFVEATLSPLRVGGKLYGIPYNTNARGLVYRTDIFEKNNLKVPTTWTEFVETARKITELTNKETYGAFVCTLVGDPRAPQEFISWYFQVSGKKDMFDLSSGKPQLVATVEQFEKVLNLYGELFKEGNFTAADLNQRGTGWPVEDPGYVAGKWAMAPMGPWLWGRRTESDTAKDILENKSAIAPLPVAEGGTPATYLEVKPIMLNAFSSHKDEAWELIKFICSKDQMGLWLADSGGIPARKDSLEIDAFRTSGIGGWIKGFADLLPQAVALSAVNWGPVNEANMRAVNYVVYGEKSPYDAAQWLFDEIKGLEPNL